MHYFVTSLQQSSFQDFICECNGNHNSNGDAVSCIVLIV